jgi:hypothetical protein
VPRPEDRCPAEQKGELIVPLGEFFKKVISIGLGRDQGDRYNLMLRTMVVQGTARPAPSSLIVFRFQRPTKPSPSSASGQTATSNWCWTLDIDTICPRQRPGEVSYCTNDGCLFFQVLLGNGGECDHHCRGKFDTPRYNFDKVFGLFTRLSHKYQLDTSGANRLYNFLDRLADLNRADEPNSR